MPFLLRFSLILSFLFSFQCSLEMFWDTFEMEQPYGPGKTFYGAIDSTGNWIIPPIYDYVTPLGEGFVKATRGKKSIILNRENKVLGDAFFDHVEPFKEGVAKISEKDLYGFINTSGEYVLRPQFTYAAEYRNGFVLATRDSTSLEHQTFAYFYANYESKGIPFVGGVRFSEKIFPAEGLFPFQCEGENWGFRDEEGKELIPCSFSDVLGFSESVSAAQKWTSDSKFAWGFIDKQGNWVIAPEYDFAESFQNGRALVSKNDEYFYIDSEGKKISRWLEDLSSLQVSIYEQCPKNGNATYVTFTEGNTNQQLGVVRDGKLTSIPVRWKAQLPDEPESFYIACPEDDIIGIGITKNRKWIDREFFALPSWLRKLF